MKANHLHVHCFKTRWHNLESSRNICCTKLLVRCDSCLHMLPIIFTLYWSTGQLPMPASCQDLYRYVWSALFYLLIYWLKHTLNFLCPNVLVLRFCHIPNLLRFSKVARIGKQNSMNKHVKKNRCRNKYLTNVYIAR